MERLRKQLVAYKARLVETLRARDEIVRQRAASVDKEEADFKAANDQAAQQLEAQLKNLDIQAQEMRKKADERCRRRTNRTKATCVRLKTFFQNQLKVRLGTVVAKQQKIHEQADEERKEKTNSLGSHGAEIAAQLEKFDASTKALSDGLAAFGKTHRVRLGEVKIKEALEDVPRDFAKVTQEIAERIALAEEVLGLCQKKFRRWMSSLIPHTILLLAGVGVWGIVWRFSTDPRHYLLVAAPLVVSIALVQAVFSMRKERVFVAGMDVARKIDAIQALIDWQKRNLESQREKNWGQLDAVYAQRVAAIDAQVQQLTNENKQRYAEITEKLSDIRDRLTAKIAKDKDVDWARIAQETEAGGKQLRARQAEALAQIKAKNAQRKREIEEKHKAEHAKLAAQWTAILAEIDAFAKTSMEEVRKNCPPWTAVTADKWRLPSDFHEEIYAGDVHVNLKGLVPESDAEGPFSISPKTVVVLPFVLTFPLEGSLYIRAGLNKREEGMQLLLSAVMRLLCSCPPARAKLTIVDPVGLGQNFAALMHLADYDESLVNNRIWSDSSHIEKKLTELTEHMEKVIQKYLRNRYASIDEYNKEAGQLAEPYRFLVIADFPAGFTEVALDRLASITSSGGRCGVYTLILHDARQKLPAVTDEKVLRRSGQAVVESGDSFILDDVAMNRGTVALEGAPPAAQVDALLNAVGKQCRDAVRVEVPFEAAAPKPVQYWAGTTEGGIRLPLGKTGADRLQCLELGRGTAQHALIAGKTGSGKSNLFHVIITNASLWYSPKEIEFYLIDFKKGVEFKTYATNRLPHARVIAIESDREFGLSVLRRLDKELVRRGELFRDARVQDLASYRKVRPGEVMPRTLLIIDEFQEFFTEDDGIGQDAALLLDRIVRQGRAFGIHVILGSQTLGGIYTLAKSTLGQMAVRIALQCNEADSYLILSDDNAAARLLSRPGEAIYNDMSGQIEGNNPFQAVFFPKSVQDVSLQSVRQKAKETGMEMAGQSVIFEGNSPAEVANNVLVREAIDQGRTTRDDPIHVWLGEANAIKGPTQVDFARQAGRNLLIVGQRADAGLSMCAATVLCLTAHHAPEDLRISILDGTPPETGVKEQLQALASALPHRIEVFEYRDVPKVVEEYATALKARRDGGVSPYRSHFLLVLGLQRFRQLRQEDEYSYSSSSSDETPAFSPSKGFSDLLTEGPSEGFHSVVWCDTLGNLNRAFGRKTLREFELRVLYQMSANDSSELIDSPIANKLGLYNALLFTLQDGAIEKFRPYAMPGMDLVTGLSDAMKVRCSGKT